MTTPPISTAQTLDGELAIQALLKSQSLWSEARAPRLSVTDVTGGLVALCAIGVIELGAPHSALWAVIASSSIAVLLTSRVSRQIKAMCTLLERVQSEGASSSNYRIESARER